MRTVHKIINNERGGLIIVSMVILSSVIVVFSGILALKFTELNKQSNRVNEAYRYLNVMEEMGGIISRARDLATVAGAGACDTGTTKVVSGTMTFCLPGTGYSTTCVEDASQKSASGASIKYCLQPSSALDTSHALNDNPKKEKVALELNIIQRKQLSLIERAVVALVDTVPSALAACDLNQNWYTPCTPDNSSGGTFTAVSAAPAVVPVALSAIPATASIHSTGSTYSTRANMETWAPSITTWTPAGTNNKNEIFNPSCDVSTYPDQYWLGCMSCDDGNVDCIDIIMCQPQYATGVGGCLKPFKQRIALYSPY